jgi:alcohol dehydrogenase class IV
MRMSLRSITNMSVIAQAVQQKSTLPEYDGTSGNAAQKHRVEALAAFVAPPLAAFGGTTAEDCAKSCSTTYSEQDQPDELAACIKSCGPPQWYQNRVVRTIAGIGAAVGSVAGAYHGYKRNDSVGWAIAWFFLAGWFWPIALPIMFAQGFGERKRS